MNFRTHETDEPELNLIPLIDVLIILLIFLVMTTTFAQHQGIELHLPEANAKPPAPAQQKPLVIQIHADGRYRLDGQPIQGDTSEALRLALKHEAGEQNDPLIVIEADRNSRHQALITTLEALEQLGFQRISFATITP